MKQKDRKNYLESANKKKEDENYTYFGKLCR